MPICQWEINIPHSDFERLVEAFESELRLWPPSEQDYGATLSKAKMHHGLSEIRLSQAQNDHLFRTYLEAMRTTKPKA
jgi:hypothetical protein